MGGLFQIRIHVKRLINGQVCLGTIYGSDVKDHQGNRIRKLNETMVDLAVRKIDRQRHVTQSVTANISAQQKT